MKSDPITVSGTSGFIFEFKRIENGSMAFIRYKEGERELASIHNIWTGLERPENREMCIYSTLCSFNGVNKRVIQAAESLL